MYSTYDSCKAVFTQYSERHAPQLPGTLWELLELDCLVHCDLDCGLGATDVIIGISPLLAETGSCKQPWTDPRQLHTAAASVRKLQSRLTVTVKSSSR